MAGITTHTSRGERAPEGCVLADAINERFGEEYCLECISLPTGDRMIFIKTSGESMPSDVERFIKNSHWKKGCSPHRHEPVEDGIFSYIPQDAYHPDK